MQDEINNRHEKTSDEELIIEIKTGNDIAFQELMCRYLDVIFNFVRQYSGNNEDAEDITQDSFFKAWKNIHSFKKGKTFKPWMYAIARNTALDWVKKKHTTVFSLLDDSDNDLSFSDSLADNEPLSDELFSRAQTSEVLILIQKELHPDYQSTLFMHYRENMTFDEISQIMEKPVNTVKSWHRRALQALKKIILHQNTILARITR